jgi:hypothetical protein
MFYGIIVRMFKEHGGRHHAPHLHALYSGHEVVLSLDGTVLEGKFPPKQLKLLLAWMEIHNESLLANWTLLSSGEATFKIEPLK